METPAPNAHASAATPAPSAPVRSVPARFWVLQLVRAVVFGVAGAWITFSADHSAQLGLIAAGGTALVVGVAQLALVPTGTDRGRIRRILQVQGAVSAAAGIVAVVLLALPGDVDAGTLLLVVGIWVAAFALTELWAGLVAGRGTPLAKDFVIVGALSAIVAVVYAFLPADLVQTGTGQSGVAEPLTSSIIAVGVFGAYAAVVAVYLAIGALSLKWQTSSAQNAQKETV